MRFEHGLCAAILLLVLSAPGGTQEKLPYPPAKMGDKVFDYAGTKVPDPYNWLEDVDSTETAAWVQAESKFTRSYLDNLPGRANILARLQAVYNFDHYGLPFKEGHRYFYTLSRGLQNQPILYVADSLGGSSRVLIDPNTLSKDGTVALNGYAISHDGRYIAYALSTAGSDWQDWHIRNIDTLRDTSDVIHWSKDSGASWTQDGKGFFYARYDKPKGGALKETNYFHKLYFHRVGDDQSKDKLIYDRPDQKDWFLDGTVTDDGHYLITNAFKGTAHENRVFYKDLATSNSMMLALLPKGDANYSFIANKGPVFYFQTDKNAPRGKLIAIDIRKPESVHWTTIIPQSIDTLKSVGAVGSKFFASYLKDAHGFVRVYSLSGVHLNDVTLPGLGTISGFGGHLADTETFYSYASYLSPTTIYRYRTANGGSTVYKKPTVAFDPTPFETKEVFFKSKDGTRVPIFLTAKKDIKLDGSNPTLMYGYGGFDIPEEPYFSVTRAVWMEMGGVYADVVLRGGGEYGEPWHQAAMKEKKQNVFDDFISAGEFLISKGYTSTPKLAIFGGSNGGLLVGAVETQRPELWGACLPAVGVMDMLRFNKFTIGWAWMSEYGNPDTASDFPYIYKYSPLHNIKAGVHYPPTLIATADHDDRVFPAHSFKFAAAMQAAQAGDAPVLIRIETKAGHGGGMPVNKALEETADNWAFLVKSLNMTPP